MELARDEENNPILSDHELFLAHAFYQDDNNTAKNLHLIHKNHHYNVVVPQDIYFREREEYLTHEIALTQQNRHLNELRERIVNDMQNPQAVSIIPFTNAITRDDDQSDISTDFSEEEGNNNNLTNRQIDDVMELEDELIDDEMELSSAVVDPSSHRVFYEAELLGFAKSFYSNTLSDLNKEQSCQKVYEHFHDKRDVTSIFAILRVALDKNFVPHNQDKETFLTGLLNKLNAINGDRQKHYAKIFRGKVLIKLGKLAEAYPVLDQLKKADEARKRAKFGLMKETGQMRTRKIEKAYFEQLIALNYTQSASFALME